ncbi:MAG: putative sugar nucleotidyl transferase, partial [Phycisphaerae bacterium]
MHKAILFEDRGVTNWLPLTYWRSFASLEWGIKTVASHLSDTLQLDIESWWTSPWTADVSQSRCSCPVNQQIDAEGSDAIVFVNMRWLPDIANGKDGNGLRLAQAMEEVAQGHGHGTAGVLDGKMAWLALNRATARTHTPDSMFAAVDLDTIAGKATRVACDGQWLDYPWDALDKRVELINAYYDQINGDSAASGVVMAGDRVQLHGTAVVRDEEGPVILADGVTIGPNAVVDGPIIIGAN